MGNSTTKLLKPEVKLTDEEKEILYRTWHEYIHEHETIGGDAVDQMFTEEPHLKDAFSSFDDIDVKDDHYNEVLHRHGSRVKTAVGMVIDSVNEKGQCKSYLTKMGKRHYNEYNFEPKHVETLLKYLKESMKDIMGVTWTSDVEVAYTKLFAIISFYMVNSLAYNVSRTRPGSAYHIISTKDSNSEG